MDTVLLLYDTVQHISTHVKHLTYNFFINSIIVFYSSPYIPLQSAVEPSDGHFLSQELGPFLLAPAA